MTREPTGRMLLLLMLWLGTAPDLTAGQCTSTTCLANGTCVNAEELPGGFRCKCPLVTLSHTNYRIYGPRCDLAGRMYYVRETQLRSFNPTNVAIFNDTNPDTSTTHSLAEVQFNPGSLMIQFEMKGYCYHDHCDILVINGRDAKPLVTVRLVQDYKTKVMGNKYEGVKEVNYVVWTPASRDHSNRATALSIENPELLDAQYHASYQNVYVVLQQTGQELTTIVTLCFFKVKKCIEKRKTETNYNGDLKRQFKDSTVVLGKFLGVIRFVKVNNKQFDLWDTVSSVGHQYTNLNLLYGHCINTNLQYYECGNESICDYSPLGCECRCTGPMRKVIENVEDPQNCSAKGFFMPGQGEKWNPCTVGAPVVSTGNSTEAIQWTTAQDTPIEVPTEYFSLHAMLKTHQINADRVLALYNMNSDELRIRISNGALVLCIGELCEFPFSKRVVSDGTWHSLSVTVHGVMLATQVDTEGSLYLLDNIAKSTFSGRFIPIVGIQNSLIRAVRLSNIYMATGGDDITKDSDTVFIKAKLGAGAHVRAPNDFALEVDAKPEECAICLGRPDETCDTSTGAARCVCKPPLVRNTNDTCTFAPEDKALVESIVQVAAKEGSRISDRLAPGLLLMLLLLTNACLW